MTDTTLDSWVAANGGVRVIRKILIANNGRACCLRLSPACSTHLVHSRLLASDLLRRAVGAAKCIRSMRRWAYQTFRREGVLHFVAMATPDDVAANAECVPLARCWRRSKAEGESAG
jgi:hypothetical protein